MQPPLPNSGPGDQQVRGFSPIHSLAFCCFFPSMEIAIFFPLELCNVIFVSFFIVYLCHMFRGRTAMQESAVLWYAWLMSSGSHANKLAVSHALGKQVSFLLPRRARALNMLISPNLATMFRYQATRILPTFTMFNKTQFPKNKAV